MLYPCGSAMDQNKARKCSQPNIKIPSEHDCLPQSKCSWSTFTIKLMLPSKGKTKRRFHRTRRVLIQQRKVFKYIVFVPKWGKRTSRFQKQGSDFMMILIPPNSYQYSFLKDLTKTEIKKRKRRIRLEQRKAQRYDFWLQ